MLHARQSQQRTSLPGFRAALFAIWILFGWLGVSAQDTHVAEQPELRPPPPVGAVPHADFGFETRVKPISITNLTFPIGAIQPGLAGTAGPGGVRRITLEEAKAQASAANNPLLRFGELQVEAAKQHRLGAQGDYFPKIGATAYNMHLNKLPGEVLTVRRPLMGTIATVPTNIITKNQTIFDVNATQPITPLFQIYQLVKLARADENIARAKAGMPVAEVARRVEKNYFDLLVAERELTVAEAGAKKVLAKWLQASNSAAPTISAAQETETAGAEKAVVLASSKVKELTASLNELLGQPEGTKLELVPPAPLVEDISLEEATGQATAANPEVVEAEQTAVKAHAGLALSKLEYMPTVAFMGGYSNQTAMNVVLPRDFSYIGLVATLNIFDGFKREHGVKERRAQTDAAELAVQLTKAKVAAGVKSSYFELERSRKLYQLASRMASGAHMLDAKYQSDDPDPKATTAQTEADMFRADFEYRQAYAKLKALMGME